MKDYSYYECVDVEFPSRASYDSKEDYEAARCAYAAEERKREKEFAEALFVLHKMEDDPARWLIFGWAWADGHDYGFYAVEDSFAELVEFIENVNKARTQQSTIKQS